MHSLYITHPQVKIDPTVPVPEWSLSDRDTELARKANCLPWAQALRHIVSSAEIKAIETARILAEISGADKRLSRRCMGKTGLPSASCRRRNSKRLRLFFTHPQESFHGWERAIDAQTRIVGGGQSRSRPERPAQPIAFIGHNDVGTPLKCYIEGRDQLQQGPAAWQRAICSAFPSLTFAYSRAPTCDWTAMETLAAGRRQ